jgi:TonB-linked SusC/RagA family outer membrane protein
MKKSFGIILLLTCLLSRLALAQAVPVSGVVTGSADGMTMPGVTVLVKGTNVATITDLEGRFSLNVPPSANVLVFSFVGYKSLEVPVPRDGRTLQVTLEEDLLMLDEVMVVAYGTARRSTYTGSASVVQSEKLEKIQTSNVSKALQGVSSGIQVLNTSGRPGSGGDIRIRGIGSLYASSGPLIVVDGVPFSGGLNSLNPSDIESVTILKDATAAALYGSRAAGGVVMITTKRGSSEQARINFSSTFGTVNMAVPYPNRANSREYFELTWESIYNGQLDVGATPAEAAAYATNNVISTLNINPFSQANPFTENGKIRPDAQLLFEGNWDEELIQPQVRQEYNLSASGTAHEGRTQYFISGNYIKDPGVFTVQQFERFSGRVNASSSVRDWLEVGTNTAISHGVEPYDAGAVRFMRSLPPIYPIWEWDYAAGAYKLDDEGNRIYDYGSYRREWSMWNPLADAAYNRTLFWYDNVTSRTFGEVTFMPGLKLRSSLSVDYGVNWNQYYTNPTYGYMAGRGSASKTTTRTLAFTQNNILSYERQLAGKHNINLMGGMEAHMWRYNYVNAAREGFPFIGLYELASAATITGAWSYEDNYRLISYLTRAEYNYDNRYYVSGSFRTDGSSRFHPDNRWGNFWSAGASWRISEEGFMQDIDWVDNFQIRTSYGAVGNDRIALYAYQGLFATGMNDGTYPGMLVSRLPTPDLKWETNLQFNLGANFRLFDRIDGSFEYFVRDSRDLLFARPLPMSTGFGSVDANIADVRNKGVELEVNLMVTQSQNFRWTMDLNATHYKNIITSLPQERVGNWIEGVSMYEFFMPEWAGVNPETGNSQWWKNVFQTDGSGVPVLDEDGNKVIIGREKTENYSEVGAQDQRDFYGSGIPDLFGGFTNNFTYKNFDLSVFVYFSIGGKMYDSDYAEMMGNRPGFTYHEDMLDRWTPDNPNAEHPRISSQQSSYMGAYSTRFLYDNTFVRLRNVTLGYSLPRALLDRMNIQTARVYVNGDNLLTFGSAAKRGTDPEQSFSGTTGHRLPPLKALSFGLQVGF